MTATFYVYDTVDREVVSASADWPGKPRSEYRPVYWAGAPGIWWKYTATPEGDRPMGGRLHESGVPEVVRLFHMVHS